MHPFEAMNVSEEKVYLSNFEEISTEELQLCYMPRELMALLNIELRNFVHIKIKDKAVVCQVVPMLDSNLFSGWQVLTSLNVMCNASHIKDFYCDDKVIIKVKDVNLLPIYKTKKIDIKLIMTSVEYVLNAKKHSCTFKTDINYLLQLYKFMKNSIINCKSNTLAKVLGICYIIVNDVEIEEISNMNWAVQVSDTTDILISSIESKERHLFLVEQPTLLGGLNPILQDLKSLILDPWNFKEEFSTLGVTYPSGVLLIGPPGCGKSSLVRQLCFQTKACLIATAGADLQSPYENETLKNFTKVAKRACALSREGPCVFFIDEIDSLCPSRTQDLNIKDLKLSCQVLVMLDECVSFPNLLVMGATNRPFALDAALRRPGRMEVEMILSAPSLEERLSILELHWRRLSQEEDGSLRPVAEATPGFVGADLRLVCERTLHNVTQKDVVQSPSWDDVLCEMMCVASKVTPSVHKSIDFVTSKPPVTPIAGLDHVKQKLDFYITNHTKYSNFYEKFKMKRPKGILLYGPRGCGKTRLVSWLCARRGVAFLAAEACHLTSSLVGESEKRVKALFHAAAIAQPSVVFIDEIDGIFGCRPDSGGDVSSNLVSELLQALDGADRDAASAQGATRAGQRIARIKDEVLIIGATNGPWRVDPALLRPGRFDRLLYVPPPDAIARKDILKCKASKLRFNEDILSEIARKAHNWTGAELENLVTQATLQSVLDSSSFGATPPSARPKAISVSDAHIEAAFEGFSPSLMDAELRKYEDFEKAFRDQLDVLA